MKKLEPKYAGPSIRANKREAQGFGSWADALALGSYMPVFRRCREWILLSSARGYSAQAYQATEHDVQAWGSNPIRTRSRSATSNRRFEVGRHPMSDSERGQSCRVAQGK